MSLTPAPATRGASNRVGSVSSVTHGNVSPRLGGSLSLEPNQSIDNDFPPRSKSMTSARLGQFHGVGAHQEYAEGPLILGFNSQQHQSSPRRAYSEKNIPMLDHNVRSVSEYLIDESKLNYQGDDDMNMIGEMGMIINDSSQEYKGDEDMTMHHNSVGHSKGLDGYNRAVVTTISPRGSTPKEVTGNAAIHGMDRIEYGMEDMEDVGDVYKNECNGNDEEMVHAASALSREVIGGIMRSYGPSSQTVTQGYALANVEDHSDGMEVL